MIVNNSSFAFLTYKFLQERESRRSAAASTAPTTASRATRTSSRRAGNVGAATASPTTASPKLMKKMGAKKVAALAYGVSASSTASAKNLEVRGADAGLEAVYTNTTVDFGSTDVGPQVLGIKNSGADAVYLPLVAGSNIAVVQGLAQNGVKMKSTVLATGYGQTAARPARLATFGPEVIMATGYAPVELKTKATKQFQADLKKYAGYTGVPDYGIYTGYITCDMAILGLRERWVTNPPGRRSCRTCASSETYDQAGLAAARSTSASTPTVRLLPTPAAGTCRSRTASSSLSTGQADDGKSAKTPWKANSSRSRRWRPPRRRHRRNERRTSVPAFGSGRLESNATRRVVLNEHIGGPCSGNTRGTIMMLVSAGLCCRDRCGGHEWDCWTPARRQALDDGRHRQEHRHRLHLLEDRCRRVDVPERRQGVPGPRRPENANGWRERPQDQRRDTPTTSPAAANKTAAQDLVQNKHVFMIVNNSSFAFLTYQFLLDAGRPEGRRRFRRHLLRRARQREHHLRPRATSSTPTA